MLIAFIVALGAVLPSNGQHGQIHVKKDPNSNKPAIEKLTEPVEFEDVPHFPGKVQYRHGTKLERPNGQANYSEFF